MSDIAPQELPFDLEDMPPGPQLAAVLAAVDRKRLDDRDRVRLVQARHRLSSHIQGELYRDMYAVTWDEPPEEGFALEGEPYPWASTELSLALRWTRLSASVRLDQARRMIEEFPAVGTALCDGIIDVPKVLVILDGVMPLPLDVARRVVAEVLAKAAELTTGQLRAWIRRLVMAIDPDAIKKAAKERIRYRRVSMWLNDDGLAGIAGDDLAPHRVAASWERINAIAKAARASGDKRSMDELRADAMLDLLIGEGIAIGEPITDGDFLPAVEPDLAGDQPDTSTEASDGDLHAAGREAAEDRHQPAAGSAAADPPGDGADHSPAASDPADIDNGQDPTRDGPVGRMLRRIRRRQRQQEWDEFGTTWPQAPADPSLLDPQADPPLPPATAGMPAAAAESLPEPPDADRLGDYGDGEHERLRRFWLAGFGQLSTTRPGRCPHCGQQPSRTGQAGVMPSPRRGVLELHMSLYTLLGLDDLPAELAEFGPVLADVGRQVVRQRPDLAWKINIYDQDELIGRVGTTTRPASIPEGTTGRRTKRRPTTEVAEFVRARNRTCIRPACRRHARSCELDHNLAWAEGGESDPNNLGPECTPDHMFKHAPGCRLIQSTSGGRFGWVTPKGMRYVKTPDPPLYDDLEVVDRCLPDADDEP